MATAREAVRLGLAARGQAKVKIRQPLREAVVVAAGREREAIERLAEVVREELNVKALRFAEAADELGALRGQAQLPDARPALRKARCRRWPRRSRRWTPRTWRRRLREGGTVGIAIDGHDHQLGPEDLQLVDAAAGGLPARARGLARGGARAGARRRAAPRGPGARGRPRVQSARKDAGLAVEDRIALDARRRRGAAGGRARARELRGRRDARDSVAYDGRCRRRARSWRSRAASCGSGWSARNRERRKVGVSLKLRSSRRLSPSTTRRVMDALSA